MPACRHMVQRRTLRGLHFNQRQLRSWKRQQLEPKSREEPRWPQSKAHLPPVSTLPESNLTGGASGGRRASNSRSTSAKSSSMCSTLHMAGNRINSLGAMVALRG